jgi:hypothetical protein
MLNDYINQNYQPLHIGVIDQSTIQEKAVIAMMKDVERYAKKKQPVNLYHGVAERLILYPLASTLFKHFYLVDDRESAYVAGKISDSIRTRGMNVANGVTILQLATSKLAVNNAVAANEALFLSQGLPKEQLVSQISKDFVWMSLTDQKYAASLIKRLKDYTVPHYRAMDEDAVKQTATVLSMGRGEAINPENYAIHRTLRSLVLSIIRMMVDFALATGRPEVFADVLPALSLYIVYINITENEAVYDTAFPTIAMAGASSLQHTRRISSFRMLAMIFLKSGYVGKAYGGLVTYHLIKELYSLFPDTLDIDAYSDPQFDTKGNVTFDMNRESYLTKAAAQFEAAYATFDELMPQHFKGQIEDVIVTMKQQTGADKLIISSIDSVLGMDDKKPLFRDLHEEFLKLGVTIDNPEAQDARSLIVKDRVNTAQFQKYILQRLLPAIKRLYHYSLSLRGSYDKAVESLGTQTGSFIPGVNIEISVDPENVDASVPSIADLTAATYARIDKTYSWPIAIPALVLNDNGEQVWSLSHLKNIFVRPELLILKFARLGQIANLPTDYTLVPDGTSAHERWSWLPDTIMQPTYMHEPGYGYTPLPYPYTYDTVYDGIENDGLLLDSVMTRTKKIPAMGYMQFGEALASYATSGAVNPRDLALSLAGMGLLYIKEEGKNGWSLINPDLPSIYGVPGTIMVDANRINLSDYVSDTPEGIKVKKDLKDAEKLVVKRFIFDRSNKTGGMGNVIFVLHGRVPATRKLRYFRGDVRNGFHLDMPFHADIYNVLLDLNQKIVEEEFKNQVSEEDKAAWANGDDVPMVAIAGIYNRTLSVFINQPAGKDKVTAEDYFNSYLAAGLKMKYKDFLSKRFVPVTKWSNVIVGFPHLSMSNRYEEYSQNHLSQWLRPFTSQIHIDKAELKNTELLMVLTKAPNIIQQMDFDDELTFNNDGVSKLSIIDSVYDASKEAAERENAGSDEEMQIMNNVELVNSKAEGLETDVEKSTDNTLDSVPKSVAKKTIQDLDKLEGNPKDTVDMLLNKSDSPLDKQDLEKTKVTLDTTHKVANDDTIDDKGKKDPAGKKTSGGSIVIMDKDIKKEKDNLTELGEGDSKLKNESNNDDLTEDDEDVKSTLVPRGQKPEKKDKDKDKKKKKGSGKATTDQEDLDD